jgi:hypothetical protein
LRVRVTGGRAPSAMIWAMSSSLNQTLMAAGLVDRVQVTLFPVIFQARPTSTSI